MIFIAIVTLRGEVVGGTLRARDEHDALGTLRYPQPPPRRPACWSAAPGEERKSRALAVAQLVHRARPSMYFGCFCLRRLGAWLPCLFEVVRPIQIKDDTNPPSASLSPEGWSMR